MKLVWLCAIFMLIVVAHRCNACWPTKMPKSGTRFLTKFRPDVWFTRLDGVGSCADVSIKVAPLDLDNDNTLERCLTHCGRLDNCTFVVFELQSGTSSLADDIIFGNDGQQTSGWDLTKGACFDFYCAEIRFWKKASFPLEAITFFKDNVSIITGEHLRFPQANHGAAGRDVDDGDGRKAEGSGGLPGSAKSPKQTPNGTPLDGGAADVDCID